MEPGEGSAAPKATVALPGTEVSLAGRAPARLAVHCNLATGGPGAATRHAPFGRPRRPLGTFPRGESTSSARRRTKPPTRNRFLVGGRGKAPFIFPFLRRFRLCGGDQGAFRSPPGPPIPPSNGRGIPPDPPCPGRGTSPCILTDRVRIGHAIWLGLGPATNRVPRRVRTLHGTDAGARTAAQGCCRSGPLPTLQG